MQREERYIVFKVKDIKKYLPVKTQNELAFLELDVNDARNADGKPTLQCVIVEHDWPEYEPTWQAIEKRVDSDT